MIYAMDIRPGDRIRAGRRVFTVKDLEFTRGTRLQAVVILTNRDVFHALLVSTKVELLNSNPRKR